jgi:CRISPR/Cas system-associated endonuclease Cas1
MFKQTDNYHTFKHINEMDPLLRRIQRGFIRDDDYDNINNITNFGYVLAGSLVATIIVVTILVFIF